MIGNEPFIYKSGGNCIHKTSRLQAHELEIQRLDHHVTKLFDSLIMKFRQLLPLCYHYLVSDQDFKKSCDEVPIFKVECICLHKMVVLEIFARMNATVL